jgi:hypothetical protein
VPRTPDSTETARPFLDLFLNGKWREPIFPRAAGRALSKWGPSKTWLKSKKSAQ